MSRYSEEDLRRIYDEVREASFPDIFGSTRLVFRDITVFGYSSPFRPRIYINTDEVNKYDWPEDAVRGLMAHELAHQVSYKRRSLIRRFLFISRYPFGAWGKRKVEREGDRIAIERGYGDDLVQERIFQFRIDDQRRLEFEKRIYLSPDELRVEVEKFRLG
jgi:hypothetical protein